ncbi:Cysteine desulfurylase [Heracleum sosnowskyi]|uniref:Cysteine desulfurylase n=1 Tax=Heracleum sosnowskyi TaxID=360622 RepID=A0AAD8JG36_9APIA|nr:Cysteine desulfurylase [Heracleum sosnowskyi]
MLLNMLDHHKPRNNIHYIEDYILQHVLPIYGNSHTSDSYVGDRMTTMAHEATEYVKKCLGGKHDDALIFCGSGTTAAIKRLQEVMGVSIPSIMRERVLEKLKSIERWVVFVGPYEHHSNILSWRQSLVELVEIGLDRNGLLDMDALKLQLEYYQVTNRPMLGSFSACSNVTGIYSDTRGIASLLHEYGAFACFDFAASGPYQEIKMRSGEIEGYDALFLSPHKFIGGPGTPGVLLMNKALYQLKSSSPSTCGGGTVDYVNGFNEKDTLYVENIQEREDAGTPAIIQKIRTALAFWIKEYVGYKAIKMQEHIYANRAVTRLLPNPNISVLGNTSVSRQAIISFLIYTTTHSSSVDKNTDGEEQDVLSHYLPRLTVTRGDKPLHGSFVAKILSDLFGIQARGGCACAGPYGHSLLKVSELKSLAIRSEIQKGNLGIKPGWTRISFPYYMSNEEFEFILAALEFVGIYGQRFLSLYHLDWKTGAWTINKKALQIMGENGFKVLKVMSSKNNEIEEEEITKSKRDENTIKYASYLETAEHIAGLLPQSPSQRTIPDGIDVNLLTFRL